MPVVKIENINEECTWGLWKITENSEVLEKEARFSEEEKTELTKISNPRRKKEWLAARVILKRIMEKLNVMYEGIRKDDACKPYLVHNGYHISLAHSFPYAGAIVNKSKPCGIDIEKPKPALYFIASKFLNDQEDKYVAKKPEDLCLAWAAKEVMFKLYGKKDLSFRDNLLIQPYEYRDKGRIKVHINYPDYQDLTSLQYERVENTVICHSL